MHGELEGVIWGKFESMSWSGLLLNFSTLTPLLCLVLPQLFAKMHRKTSDNGMYGWDIDNTIGATPQVSLNGLSPCTEGKMEMTRHFFSDLTCACRTSVD